MNKLRIDVWSDVVCPFCYVGKQKLDQAIQKLNLDDKVIVEYHSFLLDPTFPKGEGVPATEHLAKRKGMPLANIESAQHRLTEQGRAYGIDFRFDRAINFNTEDVHRLLQWAKAFDKADVLKTNLFKAHFSDGVDLSKPENINVIVAQSGLDSDAAMKVLNSDNYIVEVQQDIAIAQQIGVRGVPFFVFNRKTAISGAQPDSVFEEVILQTEAEILKG
jgi:predicted DsbA family dithiol-disulfide isomerase